MPAAFASSVYSTSLGRDRTLGALTPLPRRYAFSGVATSGGGDCGDAFRSATQMAAVADRRATLWSVAVEEVRGSVVSMSRAIRFLSVLLVIMWHPISGVIREVRERRAAAMRASA